MTDKELADRVVALGVGKANQIYPDGLGRFYQVDMDADWQTSVSDKKFVHDWRVAGALMERVGDESFTRTLSQLVWRQVLVVDPENINVSSRDESLPRAIIAAYVEAWEAKQ